MTNKTKLLTRREFVKTTGSAASLLALSPQLFESRAAPPNVSITVAAGSLDRRATVVSFRLPQELKAHSYLLRDNSGQAIPLQVDKHHQATFVLPGLKAGATNSFRLEAWKSGDESVQVLEQRNRLTITVAGHPVLGYQAQGALPRAEINPIFRRGGYLHPIYTPSGLIVTDDYPPNHLHHHGIWFAWTRTEFEGRKPDFWNMGDGSGTVEFQALDETWSGAVQAGFRARHRYVDLSGPSPKTVLNEVWEVKVYRLGAGPQPYELFDLAVTQQCATPSPLILPEYHYGGMGFRGHRDWDGKENAFFLTSEGRNRADGHGRRARWCHIGGRVEGRLAGIAILCHPANFRAPQPMRIHPTEPFFCFAPSQMGRWEIVPGQAYLSRYRYIVADGPPDRAELDRLWNDYADPPQVTITAQ